MDFVWPIWSTQPSKYVLYLTPQMLTSCMQPNFHTTFYQKLNIVISDSWCSSTENMTQEISNLIESLMFILLVKL